VDGDGGAMRTSRVTFRRHRLSIVRAYPWTYFVGTLATGTQVSALHLGARHRGTGPATRSRCAMEHRSARPADPNSEPGEFAWP
jgi:hypothetical protein